jgi:hypothetical protein
MPLEQMESMQLARFDIADWVISFEKSGLPLVAARLASFQSSFHPFVERMPPRLHPAQDQNKKQLRREELSRPAAK